MFSFPLPSLLNQKYQKYNTFLNYKILKKVSKRENRKKPEIVYRIFLSYFNRILSNNDLRLSIFVNAVVSGPNHKN